jgi:hypothetical protein
MFRAPPAVGGHMYAGMTIKPENYPAFKKLSKSK